MPRKDKLRNREYQSKWYKKNKKVQFARIKERERLLAKRLREYKATLKCELCCENHPACIDFHHRDVKKKEVSISYAVGRGWGWTRIMKEIEKCQVLCANCHRKLHWDNRGENTHSKLKK